MSGRWHAALGYALTGTELVLPEPGAPDLPVLLEDLDHAGWPAVRLAAHISARIEAEQPWPHQIPAELRAGCGAAQLGAALAELQRILGFTGLLTQPPAARRRLNTDELRLLREVPPHHGS